MSLSTTTTATYDLAKYSRAYNTASTASTQTDLEWQHFVNPVIRLMMDTRKSSDGRLESYRLRIVWIFSPEMNAMDMDQREVVFEDLDLVVYSTVSSFQVPQNIPLKAVYQGAVVGLRYQHPRVVAPGQTPCYRRFQVTFRNETSATAFVDSIRFICPCKANTGPPARIPRPPQKQNQANARIPASSHPEAVPHTAMLVSRVEPSILRQPGSSMIVDDPPPIPIRRTNTTRPSFANILNGSNGSTDSQGGAPVPSAASLTTGSDLADFSRPSSAVSMSSAVAQHSSSDPSAFPPVPVLVPAPAPVDTFLRSSSFSSVNGQSSPPLSSRSLARSPELMPPPPVPRLPRSSQTISTPAATPNATTEAASGAKALSELKSDMAAALRDSAGLYELSKDELEKLVAEVIREEGFVELMHSLDGMWKIKGLAGIQA